MTQNLMPHLVLQSLLFPPMKQESKNIQGVTGGTDQTSGGCSLC